MPSKSLEALTHIRDNVLLAREMVKDMTLGEFERNRILFYAATRALEIISEAARRLPGKIRDWHPHLPWREILDTGNFYRHQYDNVVECFVWRTIHHSLGPRLT